MFVNKLLSRSFTSLHRAVRRRAIRRRRVRRRQGTYHVVGGGGLFCEALLPLCNSISSKRPQIRSLMPSTILGTAIVFPTRACWRTVFSFYRRAAVKRVASIRHGSRTLMKAPGLPKSTGVYKKDKFLQKNNKHGLCSKASSLYQRKIMQADTHHSFRTENSHFRQRAQFAKNTYIPGNWIKFAQIYFWYWCGKFVEILCSPPLPRSDDLDHGVP